MECLLLAEDGFVKSRKRRVRAKVAKMKKHARQLNSTFALGCGVLVPPNKMGSNHVAIGSRVTHVKSVHNDVVSPCTTVS